MTTDPARTLETLRPTKPHAVMDLVAEAGIDVSAWGFKQDPTDPARTVPVARPRANPKFCYEWAFGDDSQGYVLCVWHSELKAADLPDGPAVVYSENVRELALSLDRIKIDNRRSAAERNRARDQARRAVAFDLALQRAFRKHQPVRLIINEGDRRPEEELGTSKSTVEFRHLDPVPWTVRAYDEKGLPLLVRGFFGGDEDHPGEPSVDVAPEVIPTTVPDAPHAAESPRTPVQQAFVDQFSDLEPAASREFVVSVRERSAAVRERVLRRAAGACELCGRPGFRTLAGAVYLETHHVIPLAEDGPDHETNVLALCPDDHRRAHYAHDRESLTGQMMAKLAALCEVSPPM